jgi:hypothetical protein
MFWGAYPYRTTPISGRVTPCILKIILINRMNLEFSNEIWYWKGPAPWYFVTVPEEESADIKAISQAVTYGWGMIPVTARIGKTTWTTSLFEKDNRYIVPIKASIRAAENLQEGDTVTVSLTVQT